MDAREREIRRQVSERVPGPPFPFVHSDKVAYLLSLLDRERECLQEKTDELAVAYGDGGTESEHRWFSALERCQGRNARLTGALERIALGEGRFSRDQLTHASNTVEDMKALARAGLAKAKERP